MNGNNNNYHYTEYGDEMSLASYNSIIGAVLFWGFALSAIIVHLAGDYFLTWNPIVLVIAYLWLLL